MTGYTGVVEQLFVGCNCGIDMVYLYADGISATYNTYHLRSVLISFIIGIAHHSLLVDTVKMVYYD